MTHCISGVLKKYGRLDKPEKCPSLRKTVVLQVSVSLFINSNWSTITCLLRAECCERAVFPVSAETAFLFSTGKECQRM